VRAAIVGRDAILAGTGADHGAALVLDVDHDDVTDRTGQVVVQAGLDRLAIGLAEHQLDRLLVGLHAEEPGDQPDHHGGQHDQDDSLVRAEAAGNEILEALLPSADDVFHIGRTA
jgi:hypothetical protein